MAREGVPIRVRHLMQITDYRWAVRIRASDLGHVLIDEIPLPGRVSPRNQLAVALTLLRPAEAEAVSVTAQTPAAAPEGAAVRVRRFPHGDSVFIDDEYLMKGVAGAIARKLAKEIVQRCPTCACPTSRTTSRFASSCSSAASRNAQVR